MAPYLSFPPLAIPGVEHLFTLRREPLPNSPLELLSEPGFSFQSLVQAEQIHGSRVAAVDSSHADRIIPEVDALITRSRGLALVVRVADCGPVYLYDPVQSAIGLVHSGRKGTEAEIVPATIRQMEADYGCEAQNLVVVLGPCIRPPLYETNFALAIGVQVRMCGVTNYYDCGMNTGADLGRFYSYRMEKGQTGRHYAVLQLV